MAKRTSRRRRIWNTLGILVLFFLIIVLAVPRVFKLQGIQNKIKTHLTRQLGGVVDFKQTTFRFFPRPVFQINQGKIIFPEKASGSFQTLSAFPKLFPMLAGKIHLTDMSIEGLDLRIELPLEKTDETTIGVSGTALNKWIAALFSEYESWDISEQTKLHNARLALSQKEETLFFFENIQASIRHKSQNISATVYSHSTLWDSANITLRANPNDSTGELDIALKQFQPCPMIDYFFGKTQICLAKALLDSDLHVAYGGSDRLTISLETEKPVLTIEKDDTPINIQAVRAIGELIFDKDKTRLTISDLDLYQPKIKLSGEFQMDRQPQRISYSINAREADVPAIRKAALVLAGNKKVIRNLAHIVRAGHIPWVTIQNHADSPAKLKKTDNLLLHGKLQAGKIYLPKLKLTIEDTEGEITVSNNTLAVQHVTGRIDNSTGRNGEYTTPIGYPGPKPYYFSGDINADLSQLPLLLKRLVKNDAFANEMKRIEKMQGRADGKLILDRRTDRLLVLVDGNRFQFDTGYLRIPFALSVSGGAFSYRPGRIDLQQAHGRIGNSTFSHLDASVDWQAGARIAVTAGQAELEMESLYPWITSFSKFDQALKNFQPRTGSISIDTVSVSGTIQPESQWDFDATGQMSHLTLQTPVFTEPISLEDGQFRLRPNHLEFTDAHALVMDADLELSGNIDGFQGNAYRFDANLRGEFGPKLSAWIQDRTHYPSALKWRTPVQICPLDLTWHQNEETVISGKATVSGGPTVDLTLSQTRSRLTVSKLTIQDRQSNAEITIERTQDSINAGFTGNLEAATVTALLRKNDLLSGSITGDVKMRYLPDSPHKPWVWGRLQARGVNMAPFHWPFQVDNLNLSAEKDAFTINHVGFVWDDIRFGASGNINLAGTGAQFDMDLSTDQLTWEQVQTILNGLKSDSTPERTDALWPIPLDGVLRVKCDAFTVKAPVAFRPLVATLSFLGDSVDIVFSNANICGISTPGLIVVSPQARRFDFRPRAFNEDLAAVKTCLFGEGVIMDGRFGIEGGLTAEPTGETPLLEAFTGNLAFSATDGRIYRIQVLAKLFSMINVAEIVSGNFPDLEKEGFPYRTARVKANVRNGVLTLKDGIVDSPAMKIFFSGTENLTEKTHDLTMVVAPLGTIDMIVNKIPIVKDVLNRGSFFYPVKVTGD
ncbi:MAG: AsmA-like C-terminal domain-containing protein, partial [Deltaproteobacteria bacterium]|nr:AsmA-like C-terminal domain-containing protein [Deltaproteobacteria bacterium]